MARGFTLIGALVVLAILVLLGLAVVPIWQRSDGSAGRRAAAEVAAAYAWARDAAASRNRPAWVVLDPATGSYVVLSGVAPPAGDTVTAGRIALDEGVRLESATTGLLSAIFLPDGARPAPPLVITDGPHRYEVHVDPRTGEISSVRAR